MKVVETSLGWEIQPESSDEQARLQWLIEDLQDHRGQQPCEVGSTDEVRS
jgi:hypothetical protein